MLDLPALLRGSDCNFTRYFISWGDQHSVSTGICNHRLYRGANFVSTIIGQRTCRSKRMVEAIVVHFSLLLGTYDATSKLVATSLWQHFCFTLCRHYWRLTSLRYSFSKSELAMHAPVVSDPYQSGARQTHTNSHSSIEQRLFELLFEVRKPL